MNKFVYCTLSYNVQSNACFIPNDCSPAATATHAICCAFARYATACAFTISRSEAARLRSLASKVASDQVADATHDGATIRSCYAATVTCTGYYRTRLE